MNHKKWGEKRPFMNCYSLEGKNRGQISDEEPNSSRSLLGGNGSPPRASPPSSPSDVSHFLPPRRQRMPNAQDLLLPRQEPLRVSIRERLVMHAAVHQTQKGAHRLVFWTRAHQQLRTHCASKEWKRVYVHGRSDLEWLLLGKSLDCECWTSSKGQSW